MIDTYLDAIAPVRPLHESEVQTHEGGIAREANDWSRLRRFLILGTEGGNFYTPQRELTIENVGVVRACLRADGMRTVTEIGEISHAGRAPKNEPAILALAMATLDPDVVTRTFAFSHLPRVCRTGTHLLHFAAYREALGGGWGRGMRRAVGRWFTEQSPRDLAYQAVKYRQRDGWELGDLLRLAHPKPTSALHRKVMAWLVDDAVSMTGTEEDPDDGTLAFMWDCALCRTATRHGGDPASQATFPEIIRRSRVPRETIATQLLNDAAVWDALLADMPMTAMIRTLGKMSSVGLLTAGSDAERTIVERVTDAERLKWARIHPITLLNALKVYEQGHGERGSLTWTASKRVVNALDEAFYLAFGCVSPTGTRIRLALDVSGSMDGERIAGMQLTAREASAAMALVTMAVEPNAHVVAYAHELVGVTIRPTMRLDEVIRTLRAIPMGGTVCSLPIEQATQAGAQIDAFISYTDSETWNGGFRPYYPGAISAMTASEALRAYRLRSGINARHAVVATTANQFSIADPRDPGQLDIAGFDAATPHILAGFMRGTL